MRSDLCLIVLKNSSFGHLIIERVYVNIKKDYGNSTHAIRNGGRLLKKRINSIYKDYKFIR